MRAKSSWGRVRSQDHLSSDAGVIASEAALQCFYVKIHQLNILFAIFNILVVKNTI